MKTLPRRDRSLASAIVGPAIFAVVLGCGASTPSTTSPTGSATQPNLAGVTPQEAPQQTTDTASPTPPTVSPAEQAKVAEDAQHQAAVEAKHQEEAKTERQSKAMDDIESRLTTFEGAITALEHAKKTWGDEQAPQLKAIQTMPEDWATARSAILADGPVQGSLSARLDGLVARATRLSTRFAALQPKMARFSAALQQRQARQDAEQQNRQYDQCVRGDRAACLQVGRAATVKDVLLDPSSFAHTVVLFRNVIVKRSLNSGFVNDFSEGNLSQNLLSVEIASDSSRDARAAWMNMPTPVAIGIEVFGLVVLSNGGTPELLLLWAEPGPALY